MSLVTKEFAEKMNAAGWRLISEVGQSLDHALNQRTVQFFNGMLTYIVREKYHTLILGQPEELEVWSATVKSGSSEDCFLALIEKLNQEIDVSEQRKINDLQNKIDSTKRWTKQAREYLLRSKALLGMTQKEFEMNDNYESYFDSIYLSLQKGLDEYLAMNRKYESTETNKKLKMNDTYFVLQVTLVNQNTVTIGVFKNYPTANEVSHISQEWWHMELIEKFNLMDVLIATGKAVTYDDESTPVEFEIVEKKFGDPF